MQGRRPGKTGGVFAGILEDFFGPRTTQMVENRSVERAMSDRLLAWVFPCRLRPASTPAVVI